MRKGCPAKLRIMTPLQSNNGNENSHERRRYPRYFVSARITLAIEDESLHEPIGIGEPQDISLGGLRVTDLPACSNEQAGGQLVLLLLDGEDALLLNASVVHHVTTETCGVLFRELWNQDQRAVGEFIS